jgi:dTDP-glucose 4,6-dehydratase
MKNNIIVTGGAGFIGSNFILDILNSSDSNIPDHVINLDFLTYAGNLENLESLKNNPQYTFVKGSITDQALVASIFKEHQPCAIIHFAAESHVDRSILDPSNFISTNILGTYALLESARQYFDYLNKEDQSQFRFLHVSTDEVYGSLNKNDIPFSEKNKYEPNSPYSASKASSDHLVRAWHFTYNLPTLITNCSNNYGPYQFPEKLIPLCILNALANKPIPIYGDGKQIRDWLYVKDHCKAIQSVLKHGKVGETYNVGGLNEKTNLEVVNHICDVLDELQPRIDKVSYKKQIQFIQDRPGHDRRYAIDSLKIQTELGWNPEASFESGIRQTITWYLEHQDWVSHIVSGEYQHWIKKHYS